MFRAVLPHEPPLSLEKRKFLLVHGALTPTKLSPDGEGSSSIEFWMNQREAFRNCLQECFEAYCGKGDLIQPCELIGDEPPYSKVRLHCSSRSTAIQLADKLRKLSPHELLSRTTTTSPFPYATAQRKFHVTLLTTFPLPEPAWPRASPPKFRRLVPRPNESPPDLQQARLSTRFVVITQLRPGLPPPILAAALRQAVEPFITTVHKDHTSVTPVVEVFVGVRTTSHLGLPSPSEAQAVVEGLRKRAETALVERETGTIVSDPHFFVDYATITDRSAARAAGEARSGEPSRPQCTSSTEHVEIPGLVVLPDFVTAAEEASLMAVLTGPHAPWAPSQRTASFSEGTVKRAVQHYGYVFDYQTADVLRDRTTETGACPPLPGLSVGATDVESSMRKWVRDGQGWSVLAGVTERARRHTFDGNLCFPQLNQMTVNCYQPGEGIGTHIDTPSAFADGLLSISLNSGCVMEFRQPDEARKKLVHLPPRSLLLMSGAARYQWEHMIVTRRTDTVQGNVIPRGLRVSLTLRTAIDLEGEPLPRVESTRVPPVWGKDDERGGEDDPLATPSCEREHVHAVYDAIATQWHHTRGKRGVLWPGATTFLQKLPPGSIVADVGCGDGKYFPAIWGAGSYVIGTDISEPLLRTTLPTHNHVENVPESRMVDAARQHLRDRPAVAVADCMNIPLRSKSCDAAICIAVLHHLSTFARRKQCLEELVRIVRPGGMINIQAWAMDQEESSRRKFAASDVFVPFNAQPKYLKLEKDATQHSGTSSNTSKSTAQAYSETFQGAEFDDRKGLVVFKRYCHLYKQGELEMVAESVSGMDLIESGFESGNYYIIMKVK